MKIFGETNLYPKYHESRYGGYECLYQNLTVTACDAADRPDLSRHGLPHAAEGQDHGRGSRRCDCPPYCARLDDPCGGGVGCRGGGEALR